MSFFKSPWFGLVAAALGGGLTYAAGAFPQYAVYIAMAATVLHGLTAQSAKNSPSPQLPPVKS